MRAWVMGLCAAAAIAGSSFGATAIHGPEYSGVFEAQSTEGVSIQLERQRPQAVTKVRAFGYGGAETYVAMVGDRSPVRFESGRPVVFILRVDSQSTDPAALVQFFLLKHEKGARKLSLAIAGPIGINGRESSQLQAVPFHAEKYGQNFFKITPNTPLAPGEYGLSTTTTTDIFLFGVD